MWTLVLPLSVETSKKGKLGLNMNEYRNAHFYELNAAKQLFSETILPLVLGIPSQDRIKLRYDFYVPNRARRDLMNVVAVVDKFFSDVLPKGSVIEDDHCLIIPAVDVRYAGIDKDNPRVEVTIIPLPDYEFYPHGQEPTIGAAPMSLQLTIGENVIKAAIWAYLSARPLETLDNLSMTAGRNGNGFSFNLTGQEDLIREAIKEACGRSMPGLDLDIALHATRGVEGYTATITAGLSLTAEGILSGIAPQAVASQVASQAAPQVTKPATLLPTPEPIEEPASGGPLTFEDADEFKVIQTVASLEADDDDIVVPSNEPVPTSRAEEEAPAVSSPFRRPQPVAATTNPFAKGASDKPAAGNPLFAATHRPNNKPADEG